MVDEAQFCERCGSPLSRKTIEGKERQACPACGHVVFLDPKVAAVVLVSMESKLVMVRRGMEPAIGRWAFPSGYVDRGEAVEDAAVREVKEETGLDVRLIGFVGLYSRTGNTVVLAAYSAEATGGRLQAGGDASETALFDLAALPELPLPHDDQILSDWRRFTTEATEKPIS